MENAPPILDGQPKVDINLTEDGLFNTRELTLVFDKEKQIVIPAFSPIKEIFVNFEVEGKTLKASVHDIINNKVDFLLSQ